MDPSGPSQPSLNEAYAHPSNSAQSSSEHTDSTKTSASQARSGPTFSSREPNDVITDATPSSLGYGVQDSRHDAGESLGQAASDLEGEQMRAPGDGDIARMQERKGGFGEQKGLTEGLDRKKEEQQALKQERGYTGEGAGEGSGGVDVEGAIGGEKGFVGAAKEDGREFADARQGDHTHV